MYSYSELPQPENEQKARPSITSNLPIQLIPVIVEMIRSEYHFTEPVALYMGDGVYRVFDLFKPTRYVSVHFIKDEN